MTKKLEKRFFVFEKITSEFVGLNCFSQEKNTIHRHSVYYETVFRFFIFVTETFCQAIVFAVINKYGKGAALQISAKFG